MKYSQYLFFLITSIIIFSCKGEESTDSSDNNNNNDDVAVDTTVTDTLAEEQTKKEVFTVNAIPDGPDNSFYLKGPSDESGEELPYPDFNELHIVPYDDEGDEENAKTFLTGIMGGGFQLWGQAFTKGEFDLAVFYNRSKSKKMAEYHLIDGKPHGMVTMFKPEGDVYLNRKYDHGDLIESFQEPYCIDWTFDQAASSLKINDKKNGFEQIDEDYTVVGLIPSMHESNENTHAKVIEKESFKNQFKINDKPFTGLLIGYQELYSLEPVKKYELEFEDGYLHGDVKIYSGWGELELHEIFVEGDLDSTIYQVDPENMCGVAKPIIYLYPEKETYVNVELEFKGELTTTYPTYNMGWNVLAKPDGTLIDEAGKEYYALYWEGENTRPFTIDEGFVVKGEETRAFLEKSLATLGLNRREANEFIVFWLPHMEKNPYNLIHFSTDEYEEMAHLKINPKPESLIRVMMAYKPLDKPIDISQQNLQDLSTERKGFTVVEWGGHQINTSDKIVM